MTTNIHIHLHYDHTPTVELPAIDDSVPSCVKPSLISAYNEGHSIGYAVGTEESAEVIRNLVGDVERLRESSVQVSVKPIDKRSNDYLEGQRDGFKADKLDYEILLRESHARERDKGKEVERLNAKNVDLAKGLQNYSDKLSQKNYDLDTALTTIGNLTCDNEVLRNSSNGQSELIRELSTKIVGLERRDLNAGPSHTAIFAACQAVLQNSVHVAKGQSDWLANQIRNLLKGVL